MNSPMLHRRLTYEIARRDPELQAVQPEPFGMEEEEQTVIWECGLGFDGEF